MPTWLKRYYHSKLVEIKKQEKKENDKINKNMKSGKR